MFKRKIKKWLLGTDLTQEYICTGLENFTGVFRVFLSFKGNSITSDVSATHIFLGYKPLVIGIPMKITDPCYKAVLSSEEVCLSFNQETFNNNDFKNEFPVDKGSPASLFLKKTGMKKFDDVTFFIFEGIKGRHRFLSAFHQFTNQLLQRFKNKDAGNVALPGNLYDQVRIIYSIPRIISMISLGMDKKYNIFPTDLHGSINEIFYVSSLRHEGNACMQVEQIKKIVLANVSINCFREAYKMGKNHTQQLKLAEAFKMCSARSEKFNYPLISGTLSYKELELIDSFDSGIHRLLFYKIVNTKILNNNSVTLSHIHRYCEAWRTRKGMKTEIFIR